MFSTRVLQTVSLVSGLDSRILIRLGALRYVTAMLLRRWAWLILSDPVTSSRIRPLHQDCFACQCICFTANTRANASHTKNLLIHFCTVSSGDVYSSSHWSEIDFQTWQSLTHKTILTNSDRKTGTNAAATARIVHFERCIDICQCIFDSHPCEWAITSKLTATSDIIFAGFFRNSLWQDSLLLISFHPVRVVGVEACCSLLKCIQQTQWCPARFVFVVVVVVVVVVFRTVAPITSIGALSALVSSLSSISTSLTWRNILHIWQRCQRQCHSSCSSKLVLYMWCSRSEAQAKSWESRIKSYSVCLAHCRQIHLLQQVHHHFSIIIWVCLLADWADGWSLFIALKSLRRGGWSRASRPWVIPRYTAIS